MGSSVLGAVLSVFLSGFLIGLLARFAVPGPDPMPIWLTVAIGLGGSAIGGGIAAAIVRPSDPVSSGEYFAVAISSIAAAALLVALYRRFVQRRPILGPGAHEFPTRGFGIERFRRRLELLAGTTKAERLRRLDEAHARGEISDEEYVARRREILREG